MGRKKKFVVEIGEKYVDQEKQQMVTYIIGKAYDLSEVKKKVASNRNSTPPPPPTQISNGASLTILGYVLLGMISKFWKIIMVENNSNSFSVIFTAGDVMAMINYLHSWSHGETQLI